MPDDVPSMQSKSLSPAAMAIIKCRPVQGALHKITIYVRTEKCVAPAGNDAIEWVIRPCDVCLSKLGSVQRSHVSIISHAVIGFRPKLTLLNRVLYHGTVFVAITLHRDLCHVPALPSAHCPDPDPAGANAPSKSAQKGRRPMSEAATDAMKVCFVKTELQNVMKCVSHDLCDPWCIALHSPTQV